MNNEKFLVNRDDATINAHKKRLEDLQPRYQQLIRMYFDLKLDAHSRSIPEIIKNAFMECREQVRKGLPPALKDTDAVETITLNGEKDLFVLLGAMRKNGDLDYLKSFNLTKSGDIEINQESLLQFENQHSLWLTDLKGKELLENVVEALNDFQKYSEKSYINANLVVTEIDGGVRLNAKWRLCNRDKNGDLTLNLEALAMFERTRI